MRRAVAAALLAAALLGVVPASPAQAATAPPALLVAPRNGGMVGTGDLDVDVTITNPGTTALPPGLLRFSADPAPVASASTLLSRLAHTPGQLQGLLLSTRARTPSVAPGTAETVRVRLDGDQVRGVTGIGSGARVLYAELTAGRTSAIAQSAVVKLAKGFAPRIGFGTVIPVVAPAGSTGVVDVQQQDALASPRGAWDSALAAARAMPSATVALDPEVIASIRLAGDAAPASASGFLDALAGLPNPVVRLPYADTDITLARRAGLTAGSGPTSFQGSSTAVPPDPGATPTPTPAPAGTTVPTVADLTAWNWSDQRLVWPVPGTTSVAALRAQDGDAVLLLGSGNVKDTPQRAAAGPFAEVGGRRSLVVDQEASTLLRRAAAGGAAGRAAVAPLVGLLATDLVSRTAPAVLTSVGRGADVGDLPRVLGLLDRLPWVDGRSTQALASSATPASVQLDPGGSVAPARIGTARALVDDEAAVRDLGRSMRDPAIVTGPARLALLGLLSAEWRDQDGAWRAASATAAAGLRAVRGRVRIANGQRLTPIGSDGQLTVSVQNDLPRTVTVDIHAAVSNGRLRFKSDRPQRIEVPAGSSAQAKLPYRSITNGPTRVTLTLTTPRGTDLGAPSVREVQVQAGFDTVVAVILLTLLGLLLALGVYRNVRRRSRPRMATA